MDLAGNLTCAVVFQKVVFQQCHQLRLGFVFLPASAKLLYELWVYSCIGGRAFLQKIAKPINSATLIRNEKLHLWCPG